MDIFSSIPDIIYYIVFVLVALFGAKLGIPAIMKKIALYATKGQKVSKELDDLLTEVGNRMADGDLSQEDVATIFKEGKDVFDVIKGLKRVSNN